MPDIIEPKTIKNLQTLIDLPKSFENFFPQDQSNKGYWNYKIPVSRKLVEGDKATFETKRFCINKLLDAYQVLQRNKPVTTRNIRVMSIINLPSLFNSEIIVFFGDDYFNNFFDRNNSNHIWSPLPSSRSLTKEWGLLTNLAEKGYVEHIKDEDYVGEVWFLGDLSN